MIIHGEFYDGVSSKPELDDALAHYGVMGMKWGVRKNPEKAYSKARAKSEKLSKKYSKAYDKYLKKAKKNKMFPIKLASTRSVARARAKADLIDAKKKKWDEQVEKVFSENKQKNLSKLEKMRKEHDSLANAGNHIEKWYYDTYLKDNYDGFGLSGNHKDAYSDISAAKKEWKRNNPNIKVSTKEIKSALVLAYDRRLADLGMPNKYGIKTEKKKK